MQEEAALRDQGPFDIIGDIHGCLDELVRLLDKLGYKVVSDGNDGFDLTPPVGRRVIFLGDLVNRGPEPVGVLRLVMRMVEAGQAYCLRGNHDEYVRLRLRGREIVGVGRMEMIDATVSKLKAAGGAFTEAVLGFIEELPWRIVLDEGRLVVAHGGLPEELHRVDSDEAREFAINGSKAPQIDEFGRARTDGWSSSYRGRALVVYGHNAQAELRWSNNTICLDTGCVYGGRLTALRYPERRLVSVLASRTYYETRRAPFIRAAALAAAAMSSDSTTL